jgi:putative Ca2+/H+ antiporter (TMEM165/GDT1 family)
MGTSITTYLIAVGAVTLAEMGDKTQLLAMCFAARYKASKVLIGVFLATILNHALAVGAGYLLKEVMSQYSLYIQVVASLSFIGFALWTIRGDTVDDTCDNRSKYGPIATVAIAFFIAEMGDKTQFATVSLAASYGNPLAVLLGTTTGMLIADGIGIIFGVVLNKKIPEKAMKWIAASIFAICGLAGYIQALAGIMELALLVCTVLIIIVLTICIALWIIRKNNASGVGKLTES